MSKLFAGRCGECGLVVFPTRLLCPRCASRSWEDVPLDDGAVEETTTVRSRRRPDGVALGSVRLAGDGVVIARLEDDVSPGDAVAIEVRDGAIVARRHPV